MVNLLNDDGSSGDDQGIDTGAHDVDTAHNSSDRVSAVNYAALSGSGGFATKTPSSSTLQGTLVGPTVGTNAAIGGGAEVTTNTGDIDVSARENLHMTMTQGGVAIGLAGIGAGIGIMNVASNVSATAGGTLSAGGTLGIHANLYESVDDTAFAGAAGWSGSALRWSSSTTRAPRPLA